MNYIQWTGNNYYEICDFIEGQCNFDIDKKELRVVTEQMNALVSLNNYIVKNSDEKLFEILTPESYKARCLSIKGKTSDEINHPSHYTKGKIECIEVIENMNFCLGSAIKYIWRADFKGNKFQDLKKAIWFINRELEKEENKDE